MSLKHRPKLFGRDSADIPFSFPSVRALGKPHIPNNDEARRVCVDYTMAAVKVFTENAAAKEDRGSKFRFIYVSGMAVQRDQTKSVWFMSDYRKIRVREIRHLCRRE